VTDLQNPCLLHNAREVRERLFIDGRRRRPAGLPDLGQVFSRQDGQDARCHSPIKAYAAVVAAVSYVRDGQG
jgi:hypothetical protein